MKLIHGVKLITKIFNRLNKSVLEMGKPFKA
jgi:hypothetical protein